MGEVMKERFHFLSRDGKTKINAVKWIPKSGSVRAVMQMTHGMIEYIERYDEFACYLAGRGFLAVGHDHLGHGDSVTDEAEWGYFSEKRPSETAVADMHQVTRIIQNQYPDCPYFILGHSMGSFLLQVSDAAQRGCHGCRYLRDWNAAKGCYAVWHACLLPDRIVPRMALPQQVYYGSVVWKAICAV